MKPIVSYWNLHYTILIMHQEGPHAGKWLLNRHNLSGLFNKETMQVNFILSARNKHCLLLISIWKLEMEL